MSEPRQPTCCPFCNAASSWISTTVEKWACGTIIDHARKEDDVLMRADQTCTCRKAELAKLHERIQRLEEAGSILWKKATCITVRECYDKEMDEVPVADLPPDTVVFEYDHGDGIPAKAIVELNDALDGWLQANGKPSPPDPREWFRVVGVRREAIVLAESAEAARAKAIEKELVGDWEVLCPVEQCVLRIGPKLPEAFS